MAADPPELQEDVELDLEQRRFVLDMFARLDHITHYDVLGVHAGADKKTIKRAYFKLAASTHPDRYFTKRLGSYKGKLEVLFARITEAYDTLTVADRRAAYDARLRAAGVPAAKAPVDPATVAKRQAALDELRLRFAENQARAQRHVEAARRARAAGDLVAALEAYELALALTPRDPALQVAHAEAQKAGSAHLTDAEERQAKLEERFGHWAEAARSWQRVAAARPDDEAVKARLAAALAKAGQG
jgi:curved DNA-binding protein CbpA